MNKRLIIFLFFGLSFGIAMGQDSIGELPSINLLTISQESLGNSYVTFPTDIGNIEPLWFEGNIIPNFILRSTDDARLIGVITPQIIIRMYQEYSLPVKTPSYIPQITVYYSLSAINKINSSSVFGKIAHHSNGQEDDFYLPNGDINLESGNFSTNYLEFGFIKTNYSSRFNAVRFFSSSFQVYPKDLVAKELIGLYSLYRLNTVFSIFKIPDSHQEKASFAMQLKSMWMFGDFNNLTAANFKRLNLSLRFSYYPTFLEDIGLFIQYYHGYDYYNIYFNEHRDILRLGIITEKLRF